MAQLTPFTTVARATSSSSPIWYPEIYSSIWAFSQMVHDGKHPCAESERAKKIALDVYVRHYKTNGWYRFSKPEPLLKEIHRYGANASLQDHRSLSAKNAIWPFAILVNQFAKVPVYGQEGAWNPNDLTAFLNNLSNEKGSPSFKGYLLNMIDCVKRGCDPIEALDMDVNRRCPEMAHHATAHHMITQPMPPTR